MPVAFTASLAVLRKTLRTLFVARPKGRIALLEYIDIMAENGEVAFEMAGASSRLPAEIQSAGYARVPFPFLERLHRVLRTIPQKSVLVSIEPGQVKAGSMTFRHEGITTRVIGARIADLPIDASLLDTVSLLVRFRQEELEDSGLMARTMAAEQQAADLIDRAAKVLEPLGIRREDLSRFVWQGISQQLNISQ